MSKTCPNCHQVIGYEDWREDTEWGGTVYHVFERCYECDWTGNEVYETENSDHLETFYEYGIEDRSWDELTLSDFEGREHEYFKMLGEIPNHEDEDED